MFQLAAHAEPGSYWSSPELPLTVRPGEVATAPSGDPGLETAILLGLLDEAAEAFSDLTSVATEDIDDFERGLRHLKRIVLTRGSGEDLRLDG